VALPLIVIILAISTVRAMPDPFSTLVIWPVGTPEGSEGPIVTTSPAELIIFNIDNARVLDDVWLLIAINKPAYDHLVSISTNVSLSFLPTNFEEISGTASPADRIPPGGAYSGPLVPPYAYIPNDWPGIEFADQYDVGSLRSKLAIPKITDQEYESMYYAVGDLDSSAGWVDHGPPGLNKHDPEFFTITVNLSEGAGNWRVLVMALGHSNDWPENPILNVRSPYTRSTLIVPELPAIILASTAFGAFGLYKLRLKRKKKIDS